MRSISAISLAMTAAFLRSGAAREAKGYVRPALRPDLTDILPVPGAANSGSDIRRAVEAGRPTGTTIFAAEMHAAQPQTYRQAVPTGCAG